MLSNAFSIGVSGVKTAQKVTDMISHNIANIDTPGYKRLDNHNYEINFSGPDNKPFMPAGVDTTISSNDYPWLDKRMNNALAEKAMADAVKEGTDEVARVASDSTLSESFTNLMNATQDLQANPNDQVVAEAFHQAGEAFTKQMNRVDKAFEDVTSTLQEKIDFNQIRMDALQAQMAQITKNPSAVGEDAIAQMNFLKQQLAQVSGTIEGYNKVLSKIIPPVTTVYAQAKQDVIQGTNNSYGKELISTGATEYSWNRENGGDIVALTEFGSQQFNKDMGRAATIAGSLQEAATIDANFGSSNVDGAKAAYDSAYGVDMTEQATKLLQYQRIYEANTKVIQAADNMIGSLLDIFN
jgi:flagellar hook-associated protein FlgK